MRRASCSSATSISASAGEDSRMHELDLDAGLAGHGARLLEHRAAVLAQHLLVVVDLAPEPADLVGEHDHERVAQLASQRRDGVEYRARTLGSVIAQHLLGHLRPPSASRGRS